MFRDTLTRWFVQRVLLPRQEIIDIPGSIIEEVTLRGKSFKIRDFALPESLFVNLEVLFKKYAKELYCIGKSFGYNYAKMLDLPRYSRVSEGKFLTFATFFTRYVEAVYSSKMEANVSLHEKRYESKMKDYIICSKNGLGYLFSTGGIAGIWAYVIEDLSVEAVQPKCQGRGDPFCNVVVAPFDALVKEGYSPLKCSNLLTFDMSNEYFSLNKLANASETGARYSLKDLIDMQFLRYSHGQIQWSTERFFLVESSFMYILEKVLSRLDDYNNLYSVSFDCGKLLYSLSKNQNPVKFILDFFPALGFGSITALKKGGRHHIYINHFPWTEWWRDIEYTMVRGIFSGILSAGEGREVHLKLVSRDISQGYLSLHFSE